MSLIMNWLKSFRKKQVDIEFSTPIEVSVWVVEWNYFIKGNYDVYRKQTRKTFYLEEDADEMIKRLTSASEFIGIKKIDLDIKKYKSA